MRSMCVLASTIVLLNLIAAAQSPRPLPLHPGNIFLEDEAAAVPAAGAWQLFDYDGKLAAQGQAAEGKAALGKLPVGYYELKSDGKLLTTIGILHALQAPTPPTSPIGVDVAMAWFYQQPAERLAVANLCKLAGINWVRDRLAWGEIEPRKGQFAPSTRYDATAKIQSEAGLRVLQVNHMSPPWATKIPKRFPPDLRDAYNFYREVSRRWKGQVLAFEPWNEADIDMFGGHTGAEMAALQKASYLGLKAGNPDVIACLNVFAINRPSQLADLAANETWPYFDTCNLHHYVAVDRYPAWYASFRAVCAGRPLWVSEFSMPVKYSGDEKVQEPSDADLRIQAQRLPIVFATSLHEGSRAAFYFLFPHYVEGQTQFGIVHRDLTPRPAFLALAATGRFLADAKPLGKLKSDRADLKAYLFSARPDETPREVLVAWAESQFDLTLPIKPEIAYDVLGRKTGARLNVGPSPIFVILPDGAHEKLAIEAPPAMPPLRRRQASPLVLQAIWPQQSIILADSALRIDQAKPAIIPVFAYNFSDHLVSGNLNATGPAEWKISLPQQIELAPMDRKELQLTVDTTARIGKAPETVSIRGDFQTDGEPVLSIRLEAPTPATRPTR